MNVDPDRPRDLEKLDDVEAAFAAFVLRDVGLRPSDLSRKRGLGEPCAFASADQLSAELVVLRGEYRPGHEIRTFNRADLLIPSWHKPKTGYGLLNSSACLSTPAGTSGCRRTDDHHTLRVVKQRKSPHRDSAVTQGGRVRVLGPGQAEDNANATCSL